MKIVEGVVCFAIVSIVLQQSYFILPVDRGSLSACWVCLADLTVSRLHVFVF